MSEALKSRERMSEVRIMNLLTLAVVDDQPDFLIIIIIIIIIIIYFFCPRYLDSRGLKTKLKNSWRGYLSVSHTKLSRKRTELKRCRVIARR